MIVCMCTSNHCTCVVQQLFAKALSKILCKGSFRNFFVKALSIILLLSDEVDQPHEYSIYT